MKIVIKRKLGMETQKYIYSLFIDDRYITNSFDIDELKNLSKMYELNPKCFDEEIVFEKNTDENEKKSYDDSDDYDRYCDDLRNDNSWSDRYAFSNSHQR